ncbi:MAG: WG repeat-containing protein [Winogradskyella sp.]|uniref:WG repeat-containing protein n=1 Tax=Winogradskyella sp. TaxID=1883156 RepID=UPI0017E91AE5|nr:WG repeat-containing protein [Winogradskyella sp.]MBT8245853.1 WG repeat-containing protein [Winogradskyella sp.]NNK23076.1 WG repeat-containing protein [Winogradskyella sp.]
MKKLAIILVFIFITPLFINSQELDGINFISPYNDGVAAVKKANKWGFINTDGKLVVNYRDDLVLSNSDGKTYPIFNSGRCLIYKEKEGISYFGYIDKNGNTILKPQYLNASNFKNDLAIVIELHKNILGKNDILDKKMIDYSYTEIAINPSGKIIHFLSEKPTHIKLSKEFVKSPPEIKSKFISEKLIAFKNKDKTWSIKNL